MTRDDFWAILAAGPPMRRDDYCEELIDRLSRLPAPTILAFDQHLTDLLRAAYRADLWGAAYLINDGCSDDGFEYFRCWLVSQGREVYEAALDNPDSLAGREHVRNCILDWSSDDCDCEQLLYSPDRAYKRATGRDMPPSTGVRPHLGAMWDFNDIDEMIRRYPRLSALIDEADALA
ncbi:DUF4240 domain-containing protein [Nonomuraea fuscirosea]|uniref:DUF4240 domain-containing protein n=1 Tax=Nonomuraea fuscirosea TaxID=1291556 RepID=UPI0034475A5F